MLALLGGLLGTQFEGGSLAPTLAFIALAATLFGFAVKLGELPPVAQILLLAAQGLALFPTENGEPITGWSAGWVMICTLAMIFLVRQTWLRVLDPFYALALAGLVYHAIRPDVSGQMWMIDAALLSVGFLVIGALARVWSLAWIGQIFLAVSIWHFFQRVPAEPWAAAVPLTAVFATGRAIHRWLHAFPGFTGARRQAFRTLAFCYQLTSLVMLVDALGHPGAASASGAHLPFARDADPGAGMSRRSRAFGVRCSFVLSGLGALLIFFAPVHLP